MYREGALGSVHFSELCLRYVIYALIVSDRSKMRLLSKAVFSEIVVNAIIKRSYRTRTWVAFLAFLFYDDQKHQNTFDAPRPLSSGRINSGASRACPAVRIPTAGHAARSVAEEQRLRVLPGLDEQHLRALRHEQVVAHVPVLGPLRPTAPPGSALLKNILEDALCFLNVWSAKRLNWSIVTRAHAPRQHAAERHARGGRGYARQLQAL
jgi:hypothetical protein